MRVTTVIYKKAAAFVAIAIVWGAIAWLSAGSAISEEMAVPADMQASLFKKIFAYDKKLSTTTEIKVVVAFVDSSAGLKDEIVKAFQAAGILVKALKADQLAGNLGDISVIYLTSGGIPIRSVCQKSQILSITGMSALVENGSAAIGLGSADGKPKIIIHLGELKAEGHEVSAKLLQLAKVIE
jgi:hypothetical protein